MREISQESALVRFLRAGVLLGTMVLVPGAAVCWNLLPKPQYALPVFVSETLAESPTILESEEDPRANPVPPISLEPPIVQALPLQAELDGESFPARLQPTAGLNPAVSATPLPLTTAASDTIKSMSWSNRDETRTISIPTVVAESPAPISQAIPVVAEADLSPQQHFPLLEAELQSLGVKYYRLQKWGARGELVRVSCYVAVAETYNCQKYFQDIDRDEIRVMERVIAQIKAWRR